MTERPTPTFAEKNGYQWQPGKAYLLLGGETKDILTNCAQCGAPFFGPCQQACLNCETSRKVFYADVTNVTLIEPTAQANISSFVLPNDDVVEIGQHSQSRELIAAKINIGPSCSVDLLVGTHITTGNSARLGTVIVADNGIAEFGERTRIGRLIVGKNSAAKFGFRSQVTDILTFGNFTLKTDDEFWNGNRRLANYKELSEIISFFLKS